MPIDNNFRTVRVTDTINVNMSGTAAITGGSITGISSLEVKGPIDISDASAGQIKFPSIQHTSVDVNTLDDYSEYVSANIACTGAITSSAIWKATKIGNIVILLLPPTFGTASAQAYFEYGEILPEEFRPSFVISFACAIKDNDANLSFPGMIIVLTTGAIRVYKDFTAISNFTAGNTAGLGQSGGTSVSWIV